MDKTNKIRSTVRLSINQFVVTIDNEYKNGSFTPSDVSVKGDITSIDQAIEDLTLLKRAIESTIRHHRAMQTWLPTGDFYSPELPEPPEPAHRSTEPPLSVYIE